MTADVSAAATALELPPPPPQLHNRLTGYPIWRSPYPGWDAQQLDATIFMSWAGILFGMALAIKYRQRTQSRILQDTFRNTSVLFSTLITTYLVATFVTVTGFWFIDIGKVWVVVGTLHNATELMILMAIWFARTPKRFERFYLVTFLYWGWTQAVAIMLPFPHDAVYFKFQGLIMDFALVIQFYRLVRSNSSTALGHITLGTDPEPQPRSKLALQPQPTRIIASTSTDTDTDHPTTPTATSTDRNSDLWIVLVAAIIHLIGNCITVVSLSKYPFLVFQYTYGLTYPMYGYYVARQPGGSRILWFEATKKREVAVVVVSVIGAAVVSLIGIAQGLAYYSKHP